MTSLRDQLLADRNEADSIWPRALIVQGGGMRGVYSMGALAELERQGLSDVFDLVVGSSAGAINAAYYLAHQAESAVGIYVDQISNRSFINPLRINKIVDIDFMIDIALKQHLPIDESAVRLATSELKTVLTDADTAESYVVSNRSPELDIYEVFRATAALPALYNRRVEIQGRFYVDGGVIDAVPIDIAVQAGSRLIVAVLTRKTGYRRMSHGPLFSSFGRALSRGQSRAIRNLIGKEDPRFNEAMELLEGHRETDGQMATISIWPSDEKLLVSRTTKDKIKLAACAEMGRHDMKAALEKPIRLEL